ncbi:hypothetical protein V6N12_032738 [Hibiscus sabdariffa]|uniref:RNase H type-1 domain-containing protein n=1 Tax=Hibiscus sabdariffa TaxID=183260 RepID=A0ABR2A3J0_9ROSI
MFIWFAVHGKTLTNHERLRRYLSTSDTCFLCHNGIEDVVRVLRDCVRAQSIWAQEDGYLAFRGVSVYCPVLFVELWVVHDALKQAWNLRYMKLIIETDSADVVDLLLRQPDVLRSDTLAITLHQMLAINWEV